jgi:magnesium transporter
MHKNVDYYYFFNPYNKQMIEVYYKNNKIKNFTSLTAVSGNDEDIFGIRLIDYSSNELKQFADKFDLDLSIFSKKEDIEISSHYIESSDQLSFNFSIPNYSDSDVLSKQEVYMIIKNSTIFFFPIIKI